ncbi:MAG: S46 family peptidase [Candidatus Marinimicrobia bacterium]|nr:S46 family peptidase [Candidatus Neomarinimicrobiota bacterium]
MFKRISVIILISFSLISANEGMWLMSQINDLGLEENGFTISADEIYNPDQASLHNAIVWLGGCSASFVSSQGLVLTNHHCAYGSLQRASARDGIDYIKEGFLAEDQSRELPAPGQYAYVLTSIEDVTKNVFKAARKASDLTQRETLIKKKIRDIIKETENNQDDIYCKVVKLFEGREYRKYTFTKYLDVRIVYAPPESIGKYGGDIDNWMWPRHTGDFTFYRVYQGPDSSSARYAPENIPLNVENWLKVSTEDLKNGDPAFVIGFPGRTTRYRTSGDIEYSLKYKYLPNIKKYRDLLDIIEKLYENDPQAKLRLSDTNASLNNFMKKFQGNVDGFEKTNFIQKHEEAEIELKKFINADKKLKKRFGHLLTDMTLLLKEKESYYNYDSILDGFGQHSGLLYKLADYAYEVARERAKPEADRDPDFSEKRVREFVEKMRNRFYSYYEQYDQKVLSYALNKAANAPEGFHYFELPGDPLAWVKDAYSRTKLADPDYIERLFNMRASQMESMGDPIVQLAVQLYAPKFEKKERLRNWSARMNELREQYMELLAIYTKKSQYPDATGTMRFTYGKVEGYSPRDAVYYKPFTTLSGMIAKNTDIPPFDMPSIIADITDKGKWVDPELKDVPSCFLLTTDITNGNSGSAIMNRHGELIGLAFDGNYEAMTSDWMFQPKIQRTIGVDIRYILFVTQKFAGAEWIVEEMGISNW